MTMNLTAQDFAQALQDSPYPDEICQQILEILPVLSWEQVEDLYQALQEDAVDFQKLIAL